MNSSELLESVLFSGSEIAECHVSDLNWIDKSEIETFLHSGTTGGAKRVIEGVFSRIGNEQLKSSLLRLYIVTDIYLTAKMFAESIGISKEAYVAAVGGADTVIQQFRTQESTKNCMIDLLEKCVEMRKIRIDTSKTAINQAKIYISEHFHEPDISLGSVAASVNICAPHFCFLFKKELGETFVGYLTNERMKKAKELLCCTSKRIAQIAEEVGYNDYHYFTGLFKKLNGITPCEFRKLNSRK
ncbi:MAG: AraC family transcriptional regulator [Eubacteriales bacterium]|nr:AraC family transcriptional regulator [Eubacteriales bacterium]